MLNLVKPNQSIFFLNKQSCHNQQVKKPLDTKYINKFIDPKRGCGSVTNTKGYRNNKYQSQHHSETYMTNKEHYHQSQRTNNYVQASEGSETFHLESKLANGYDNISCIEEYPDNDGIKIDRDFDIHENDDKIFETVNELLLDEDFLSNDVGMSGDNIWSR